MAYPVPIPSLPLYNHHLPLRFHRERVSYISGIGEKKAQHLWICYKIYFAYDLVKELINAEKFNYMPAENQLMMLLGYKGGRKLARRAIEHIRYEQSEDERNQRLFDEMHFAFQKSLTIRNW